MLLGMLRGQALRPFYSPDAGGGAGGQVPPAADPAPAADQVAADPPATDPPAADPASDPAPAADPDAEEDPELTADEWQSEATKARKQAARYRTQLREAQARIAELEAAPAPPPAAANPAQEAESRAVAAERRALVAESAAEQGVPAALLAATRELHAAETPEAIAQAISKIKGFLAPASAGGHRPPAEQTTAPTLDQQIADAQKAGNTRLSISLKAQKTAQTANSTS